ncbi:MAG: hypothetical protein HY746_06305 [Elusimicrobia bacterium]|nr:hypothetical protein [Elusimicrobiota bacterium]
MEMLDYIDIFSKFNEADIKYIVVGGIAVNLHGIPRMTYDIDLLLDMEDENLKKFLCLAKEWGFSPKVPVDIMDFAKTEKREDWIKNKHMKAFCLVNPQWALSEIDVVVNTPVDYQTSRKKAKIIPLRNISIPVISIDDLIKMKKNTGRKQDEADIRYLKRLKNEK